ncbi:piggyBac transposable element-derived protein 3-like [Bacillus rossius redtenbacheri]|uniref:piggyBac transposable element-derived protein 3-like n=1 Tax=Bacillus rossius redtenbacheri TaxID=93214 RepID=UPI002FDCD30F
MSKVFYTNEEALALIFDENFPAASESEGTDDEFSEKSGSLDPNENNFDRLFNVGLQDENLKGCGDENIDDQATTSGIVVDTENDCIYDEACSSVPQNSTTTNILHNQTKQEAERKWKKHDSSTSRQDYNRDTGPVEHFFSHCQTPTDIFLVMIGDLIEELTFQSNLYATQHEKNLNLKEGELLCFLGINFMMGYHKLPSWKDYWSTSEDFRVPPIAEAMPRDRFELILRYLHANDNKSVPQGNKDKIYKIRPVVEKLNHKFQQVYNGTRELSIDESMILFKGRSTLKQYNPMKPIKRGYKLWSMADQKGYTLTFKVYQGKDEVAETEFQGHGLGERVVLELSKPVWGNFRELYFDNYFSSLSLLERLAAEKTHACGTIRANRKGLPKNLTDDKKLDRGDSDFRFSNTQVAY